MPRGKGRPGKKGNPKTQKPKLSPAQLAAKIGKQQRAAFDKYVKPKMVKMSKPKKTK